MNGERLQYFTGFLLQLLQDEQRLCCMRFVVIIKLCVMSLEFMHAADDDQSRAALFIVTNVGDPYPNPEKKRLAARQSMC